MTLADILLIHGQCSPQYYRQIRENKSRALDHIVNFLAHEFNVDQSQPMTYEIIPKLEDYLNVNIYVVSSNMGNVFSFVSSSDDVERKKNICVSCDRK